jgi:hypothetical protein
MIGGIFGLLNAEVTDAGARILGGPHSVTEC